MQCSSPTPIHQWYGDEGHHNHYSPNTNGGKFSMGFTQTSCYEKIG